MSSELHIRFNQTVELTQLADRTLVLLKELLNLANMPAVQISAWQKGKATLTANARLDQEPQSWLLTLAGREEGIAVSLFEVPLHPTVPASESGTWIGVTPYRFPLAYALAAAAATALAQLNQTVVIDDGGVWTSVAEQMPEALLETLRLPTVPRSLDEAGELFYQRLAAQRFSP